MKRIITIERIKQFEAALYRNEKESATIQKYVRDIMKLMEYLNGKELTKDRLVAYREYLKKSGKYKISSINSYLAAANQFCELMNWCELRIKSLKIQQDAFCPEKRHLTQAEYSRLVKTANRQGKKRIALIIQTIGSTGIRVSELSYITVESLELGMTEVYNKGKMRRILYPQALKKALQLYVKENGVREGAVFQTVSGKPLDRSNIWKEMKKLCKDASVEESKVFPHNLRHLFARNFYKIKNDIAKLADVLGHSSIDTTRIYMKSTGNEHRRQLDSMKMVLTT